MFISRIYLKNFIGIKNGTGLNEIEIKFPRNGKTVTMLRGGNGSGKSTLMSMLTPFKKSFDERDKKSLILAGTEGVKEIDFEDGGHVYNIKHIIPSEAGQKSYSYIKKDGVEMNDAGLVTQFEEYVNNEFKVDKEYFKVGKLGSNIDSFINFTPADRKTYIATFVEAVQKYLDAYKIVAEKAKINEQQIKQISSDLKKFDDSETVKRKIEENDKAIKDIEEIISKCTSQIAKLDVEINAISKEMVAINYLETKSTLSLKSASLKKNYQINEKFNRLYTAVNIDECRAKVKELEGIVENLNKDKSEVDLGIQRENTTILDADNELKKIETQLSGKTVVNIDDLKKEISILNESITTLSEIVKNDALTKALKSDAKAVNHIDTFKNFMNTLLSNYVVLNERSIDPSHTNCELFFAPNFSETYAEHSTTVTTAINTNRDLLDKKNAEYNQLCANSDKLDILNKRPHECHIDSCPFICDALKYKNLPEELKTLEEKIAAVKNNIDSNEEALNKLQDVKLCYAEVAKAYKQLSPRENIVYQYFANKYGKVSTFTTLPYNDLKKNIDMVTEAAEAAIDNINTLTINSADVELKETTLSKIIEAESTRLYFENEKTTQLTKKATAMENKAELTIKSKEIETALITNNNLLQDYRDYLVSLEETDTLESEIKDLQNTIDVYDNASKEKSLKTSERGDLAMKLATATNDKTTATEAITKLKAIEITINSLNENIEKLNKAFSSVDNVKNALSPKSGIPLIFIQSYLDSTETIANELLNIAYGGKFEIKFVPTAKDFFIQVRSDNNIIEDIKFASQGEISLTTISISLALIERAIGNYNIMYLDEIDGTLDSKNRDSFINILNKQIDKLGLEQVFVISHNKAFDSCAANLILLPGNDVDKDDDVYMSNKQIIFETA